MTQLIAQTVPIDTINDLIDTSGVSKWDPVWAVVTFIAGIVLSRIARAAVHRYGRRAELPANIVDLLATITMWTIVTISVVAALTWVGLNVAPLWFLLILVFVGFVVGGRALLEGFGAGVMLQARAPFEPGDLVQLRDERGVVVEVNSRVVVMDSADGRRLFIPNQQVLREPIENLTHRAVRMSALDLDVTYATDLDEAARIAVVALDGLDSVRSMPSPVAEVTSFEASAIRIRLRFWHPSDLLSEWTAVDEAARAVHRAFAAHGIEFAFPQTTLWWGEDDAPPT
jgi:small conductance mechanosensitive channel